MGAVCLVCIVSLLCGFDVPAPVSLPFQEGEELTYEVSWLGMSIGVATLKVGQQIQTHGQAILPLLSLAQNHPFLATLYEVDDRVESHLDMRHLLTRYYRIQLKEGGYRVHREVFFDPDQQQASYSKNHQPPRLLPTGGGMVQDPLSSLYVVRTLPLQVGASVYLPIFDRGKTAMTEIKVLQRERLHLPFGTITTLKLKPLLQTSGIFRREGELFVWLSDDAYRVPVQMLSRIAIGTVTARLLKVQGVDLAGARGGDPQRSGRLEKTPTQSQTR
jgi:hypothetical protein